MKRLSQPLGSPQVHKPNFNRLHRVCLVWIDYLRAETEAEKQALLFEAACHIMLMRPCGDEGEEVFEQVWQAIRRRKDGRAFMETNEGRNYVEAYPNNKFATFTSLTSVKIPVQAGVWRSRDGTHLHVYRVEDFAGLLCVSPESIEGDISRARAEAADWDGHLPCDSQSIRSMGPWDYVEKS